MAASAIDFTMAAMMVIFAIIIVVGHVILICRWFVRQLHPQQPTNTDQTVNQIEEAAFYLRESGKQSTRGR